MRLLYSNISKWIAFVLIFVVATISYTSLLALQITRTQQFEIEILVNLLRNNTEELNLMKEAIILSQKRIARAEHRDRVLLMNGRYPWERCMRIQYQKACNLTGPDDPPCQIELLKEMLVLFVSTLKILKVDYWVSYGTLLGAIRDEKIIPWTADIDIVIMESSFKDLEANIHKSKALKDTGFMIFRDPYYKDLARMCLTEEHVKYKKWEKIETQKEEEYYNAYPYLDVYKALTNNENITIPVGPHCQFNKSTIFPLRKIKLYDLEVLAPANYTKYLMQLYGPKFMIPPEKERVGHGGYKSSCLPQWQNL